MNKNIRNIAAICLFLCATTFISEVQANGLNKVDIKRSSSSASTLNVTIFTDNPYDENVAVTKKSDNKYVILMPNLSGSSASNIDYSSIQDIVSDVNLKSVEDGNNKYTKVTLTTNKPIAITTSTRKSTPLTAEQRAYKNLIAQSRGYAATDPIKAAQAQVAQKPASQPEKTVQQVTNKQETKQSSKTNKVEETNKKTTNEKSKSVIEHVKTVVLAKHETDKNKPENKEIITNKTEKDTTINKKITQKENVNSEKVSKDNTLKNLKQDIINEKKLAEKQKQTNNQTVQNNLTNSYPIQTDNKGKSKDMYTTLIILLASIAGLVAFFKGIKNSLEKSIALSQSYNNHLNDSPMQAQYIETEENHAYDNIAYDNNLNWQEKYHKFVNTLDEINPADGILKHVGNGEYEFVNSTNEKITDNVQNNSNNENIINIGKSEIINSKPAQSALPKLDAENDLKSYNKSATDASPDKIPNMKKSQSRNIKSAKTPNLSVLKTGGKTSFKELASNLERTLHNSPSIEKTNLNDDILHQIDNGLNSSEFDKKMSVLYSEDEAISKTMKKAPKLKSFANKIALEENRRRMPLPKQRSEIIRSRNIESQHVNLENSNLYSSSRRFDNANLSSADLITKNKYITKPEIKPTTIIDNNKGYTTVTLDEFFDEMDSSSKATASASLSSKVADRLGKMSIEYATTEQRKERVARSILAGKTVRAGYNINKTSGFYLVDDNDGNSSLIGSVNNNITVLKDFHSNVSAKLQVRKDDNNVYMVRLGSERFLVEISEDTMGVLIEL